MSEMYEGMTLAEYNAATQDGSYLAAEPQRGETYSHPGFAVYRYSEYPDDSVLAGQTRRQFIAGDFETEAAALAAYPAAETGGSYIPPPPVPHTPPDWFDPADVGETWDDDY